MEKVELLDKFQLAHNEYFGLLMENYPEIGLERGGGDFGPTQTCDLAIEVHSIAVALGSRALERLVYIGLDRLYPFDNAVELYSWRKQVRESKVPHTVYASIAIRIDAEIQRMRRILEIGGELAYNSLSENKFLVSKERYGLSEIFDEDIDSCDGKCSKFGASEDCVDIEIMSSASLESKVDHQAITKLERMEKTSAIGANLSKILSTLRIFFGA